MYHIHHTQGIILGSYNFGEAGRRYFIFTRDLGMITASAQGVRKISSKLKFVLQDFAFLKIDFVEGKDSWRITSASKVDVLEEIGGKLENFRVFIRVLRLLKRLLPGVEPNPVLFDDLVNCFSFLEKVSGKENLEDIEAVIVLRMLNNLGYIGENEALTAFLLSPFEPGVLSGGAVRNRSKMIYEINQALKETHL